MIFAEKGLWWLQIENFCVILRLKIADPIRESANEK